MVVLTFLWRLLILACILLFVGQFFGVCVFPETGGYGSRMACVEGEWKRKLSLFSRYLGSTAETEVTKNIDYTEDDRRRATDF